MGRLEDKVAIITGGGSGIGMATVKRFLAEGAKVVVNDIRADRLEALAGTQNLITLQGDISEPATGKRCVDAALQNFGKLDILVNNAGIMDLCKSVTECEDGWFEHVLAVNLFGPFYASRAALPVMLEQGKGVVVTVASIAGIRAGGGGAGYVASKHGVLGLTENIAATYRARGIRAVVVCPGGVPTNIGFGGKSASDDPEGMFAELSEAGRQMMNTWMASNNRFGTAEELANCVLFAASDEASFVSGTTIVADGAWTVF